MRRELREGQKELDNDLEEISRVGIEPKANTILPSRLAPGSQHRTIESTVCSHGSKTPQPSSS